MIEIKENEEKNVESMVEKSRGIRNEMRLEFDAISNNESFARVAVAAFVAPLNPTLEEMSDIKTAVSEAVTNAIIHGYENVYGYGKHGEVRPVCCKIREGKVELRCRIELGILYIEVEDKGRGIENIEKAMEPLFTTKPELERSGMGFAFMEAFMDDLEVESKPLMGTIVRMKKKLQCGAWIYGGD
jgi:stage II sporulation protein AB (anti-sigma F factor)